MTFKELQLIMEQRIGVVKLADIARELSVTPQVVSNWKSRNQVPYKYVKLMKQKTRKSSTNQDDGIHNRTSSISNTNDFIINDKSDPEEETLIDLFFYYYNLVKNNLKVFLIFPLIFCMLSFVYLRYFAEPIYVSRATIIPISSDGKNSAIKFATQFGLNLGGMEELSTISHTLMFPDIIKSRRLGKELLFKKFSTSEFGDSKELVRILNYEIKEPLPKSWSDGHKRRALNRLMRMINVRVKKTSPLITIEISSNESNLSKDIASTLVGTLNNLLDYFKLSQVKEQKIFIENRIREVEKDLVESEENLKEFREKNRNILSSPALLLTQQRLMRELEVQEQIYYTIKSQYESVQIEEIGKKSMLQVLDSPEPGNLIYPRIVRELVKFAIIGFAAILLIFVGIDWYKKNKLRLYF